MRAGHQQGGGVVGCSSGVVADWLRLMDPARGESFTSGQLRHPAALREDQLLSSDENSLHTSTYNPEDLCFRPPVVGDVEIQKDL